MARGVDQDPHSQNGEACPRNVFGLTDYAELQRLEGLFVPRRALELEMGPVSGRFDIAHLRGIHRYLFQDVFPWAGELRMVGLSKIGGAPFAAPMHIASSLETLFEQLKAENLLQSLERAAFAARAAFYLGEVNAVHPFREGNGRTQREFIRQLALHAGHTLSWARFTQAEMTAASIASHTGGDNSGLARILERAILQEKQES